MCLRIRNKALILLLLLQILSKETETAIWHHHQTHLLLLASAILNFIVSAGQGRTHFLVTLNFKSRKCSKIFFVLLKKEIHMHSLFESWETKKPRMTYSYNKSKIMLLMTQSRLIVKHRTLLVCLYGIMFWSYYISM